MQQDLLDQPSPMDKKFWDFHAKNPKVYELIIKLANDAKRAGRKRIGMKMLFEVIRWHYTLNTSDDWSPWS